MSSPAIQNLEPRMGDLEPNDPEHGLYEQHRCDHERQIESEDPAHF